MARAHQRAAPRTGSSSRAASTTGLLTQRGRDIAVAGCALEAHERQVPHEPRATGTGDTRASGHGSAQVRLGLGTPRRGPGTARRRRAPRTGRAASAARGKARERVVEQRSLASGSAARASARRAPTRRGPSRRPRRNGAAPSRGSPRSRYHCGRPPVLARDRLGPAPREQGAQQVGEQRVVAKPIAAAVERDHQRVGGDQRIEDIGRVVAPGQRVGERGADAVDDRRGQQQFARGVALARQHLVDQVRDDRAIVARELGHERLGVGVPGERQRRQPQPGRPALGALPTAAPARPPTARSRAPASSSPRLVERERQLAAADLGQRPGKAHTVQRQAGIDAARTARAVAPTARRAGGSATCRATTPSAR